MVSEWGEGTLVSGLARTLPDDGSEIDRPLTRWIPAGPILPASLTGDSLAVRAAALLGEDGRRFVVWSRAVPPSADRVWPRYAETELWSTEWRDDRWTRPSRIIGPVFRLDWVVAPGSGGGAGAIAVLLTERVGEDRVLVGPAWALNELDLGRLEPLAVALHSAPSGEGIVVVAGTDPAAVLASWTLHGGGLPTPLPTVRTEGSVSGLFVAEDRDGTIHLIWAKGLSTMQHRYLTRGANRFLESRIPSTERGVVLDGVGALSPCGQLTVVRNTVSAEGAPGFAAWRWSGSGWREDAFLSGEVGLGIFSGQGTDGTSMLAWSGAPVEPGAALVLRLATR